MIKRNFQEMGLEQVYKFFLVFLYMLFLGFKFSCLSNGQLTYKSVLVQREDRRMVGLWYIGIVGVN